MAAAGARWPADPSWRQCDVHADADARASRHAAPLCGKNSQPRSSPDGHGCRADAPEQFVNAGHVAIYPARVPPSNSISTCMSRVRVVSVGCDWAADRVSAWVRPLWPEPTAPPIPHPPGAMRHALGGRSGWHRCRAAGPHPATAHQAGQPAPQGPGTQHRVATPLAHYLDPLHRGRLCGCYTGGLILRIPWLAAERPAASHKAAGAGRLCWKRGTSLNLIGRREAIDRPRKLRDDDATALRWEAAMCINTERRGVPYAHGAGAWGAVPRVQDARAAPEHGYFEMPNGCLAGLALMEGMH